jgi:hypothetical protein
LKETSISASGTKLLLHPGSATGKSLKVMMVMQEPASDGRLAALAVQHACQSVCLSAHCLPPGLLHGRNRWRT